MENQNENSTFQQAEVIMPVENKVVEETKKEEKQESNDGRKKILTAFLMLVVTAISLTTASFFKIFGSEDL